VSEKVLQEFKPQTHADAHRQGAFSDFSLSAYVCVSLDEWTVEELVGHYVNYRKQISPSLKELLPAEKFRLYAVSTLYPKNLAKQINFIPAGKGIYDVTYGLRKIRIIVTSRISEKKRNATWLLFSGVQEKVRYGAEYYRGHLGEMSIIMNQLFVKYKARRSCRRALHH